jgi:hypothetical protein
MANRFAQSFEAFDYVCHRLNTANPLIRSALAGNDAPEPYTKAYYTRSAALGKAPIPI